MSFNVVTGDLFQLVDERQFDVIAHGCNCFNKMGKGIAVEFDKRYSANKPKFFPLEGDSFKGDINKLGQIQARNFIMNPNDDRAKWFSLTVINCYTQYHYSNETKPFDYEAFTLCMRKINHRFKGLRIGLPLIGGHLAGGDALTIQSIMRNELKDCNVTLVLFKG